MNSSTIIITMPMRVLDPTQFTYMWAAKAAQMAKDLGYTVITIEKEDTTYEKVTKAIQQYRPRLFIHFGHGCPLSLQGQRSCIVNRQYTPEQMRIMAESPVIEERQKLLSILNSCNPMGQLSCPGICSLHLDPCAASCRYPTNVGLLKGSIIVAIACWSASQLGKCAIMYGADAYVGYNDLLMFPVDELGTQDMFGNMQLILIDELLHGRSVGDADGIMRKVEDEYIRIYKKTKWVALPMLWDKIHREVLGNLESVIMESGINQSS